MGHKHTVSVLYLAGIALYTSCAALLTLAVALPPERRCTAPQEGSVLGHRILSGQMLPLPGTYEDFPGWLCPAMSRSPAADTSSQTLPGPGSHGTPCPRCLCIKPSRALNTGVLSPGMEVLFLRRQKHILPLAWREGKGPGSSWYVVCGLMVLVKGWQRGILSLIPAGAQWRGAGSVAAEGGPASDWLWF